MAQPQGIGLLSEPNLQTQSMQLTIYCISYGLQRLTFFILSTISVFYFTHIITHGQRNTGQLYSSFFLSALYISPVLVGAFVKTLPAQRQSVYWGLVLMILACASLASGKEPALSALLLFAGVGFFSANFRTVFDRSVMGSSAANLTWLYLTGNVGSVAARIIVRDRVQTEGPGSPEFLWCVGSLCAALVFWGIAQSLNDSKKSGVVAYSQGADQQSRAKPAADPNRLESRPLVLLIVTGFGILFWLGFNLKVGRITLDAYDHVRDTWLGIKVAAFRFQIVNPLVTALLGSVFALKWKSLAANGRDPHPAVKMSLGLLCLGMGLLIWAAGLSQANEGLRISAGWLVGMYALHSIGELFFEPVGQKFVLSNARPATKAFFLSVWDAAEAVAYACGGAAAYIFKNDHIYWILGFAAIGGSALLMLIKGQLSTGNDQ